LIVSHRNGNQRPPIASQDASQSTIPSIFTPLGADVPTQPFHGTIGEPISLPIIHHLNYLRGDDDDDDDDDDEVVFGTKNCATTMDLSFEPSQVCEIGCLSETFFFCDQSSLVLL
jgi:hypothetical protein